MEIETSPQRIDRVWRNVVGARVKTALIDTACGGPHDAFLLDKLVQYSLRTLPRDELARLNQVSEQIAVWSNVDSLTVYESLVCDAMRRWAATIPVPPLPDTAARHLAMVTAYCAELGGYAADINVSYEQIEQLCARIVAIASAYMSPLELTSTLTPFALCALLIDRMQAATTP